jgi:uncharacterized protein (TIGR03435 family)
MTTQDDVKLMLRALLADRFHLVVKTGSAPMPTYILSAGPGKPKMTESEGTGEGSCIPLPPPQKTPPGAPSYITVNCKNLTMAALADTLHNFAGGYIDQPVIDETNLAGAWDFTIKWTGRGQLEKQGADGISIFAAVEKQRLQDWTAFVPGIIPRHNLEIEFSAACEAPHGHQRPTDAPSLIRF